MKISPRNSFRHSGEKIFNSAMISILAIFLTYFQNQFIIDFSQLEISQNFIPIITALNGWIVASLKTYISKFKLDD